MVAGPILGWSQTRGAADSVRARGSRRQRPARTFSAHSAFLVGGDEMLVENGEQGSAGLKIEDERDGFVDGLLLGGRQPTGKLIQTLDVDGA